MFPGGKLQLPRNGVLEALSDSPGSTKLHSLYLVFNVGFVCGFSGLLVFDVFLLSRDSQGGA